MTSSVIVTNFKCVRLAQHISLKITPKRCFHFIGSAYYFILHIFSQYRSFGATWLL